MSDSSLFIFNALSSVQILLYINCLNYAQVARLQEQLQRERDLRATLEAGLEIPQGPLPFSATIDEKVGLFTHICFTCS